VIEQLEVREGERTVLIDDLDSLVARFGADHRAVVVDRLARVLRDGGGRGIRVGLAAQRLTTDVQSLASLVPLRLWLRHASRQEFVMAGGEGGRHDDRLPPGGGLWCGDRVQVAWREPVEPPQIRARESPIEPTRPLAIVSTRVNWLIDRLTATNEVIELGAIQSDPRAALATAGPRRAVLIGDPDEWQSRWGALAALRSAADILLHGCSVADYRALTRAREPPPPLSSDPGLCWRLEPDGTATRARLPIGGGAS
jgi:S-DNA-T family DNA segregation ATPase FtsK/SpoIIIE